MRAGLSEQEARRQARLEFGGLEQVKEDCRDARGTRWLEDLAQDLRYGLRLLRAEPSLHAAWRCSRWRSASAPTRAIFTLVDGADPARRCPVREPERLVLLDERLVDQPDLGADSRSPAAALRRRVRRGRATRFDLRAGGAARARRRPLGERRLLRRARRARDARPDVHGRGRSARRRARRPGRGDQLRVLAAPLRRRRRRHRPDADARTACRSPIVGVTPPDFFGPERRPGVRRRRAARHAVDRSQRRSRSWLDGRSTLVARASWRG